MAERLFDLTPEQAVAADPSGHRWVSASAGTGKTQVLTARVLRLLVGGARPEGILALTFTKAAAAEMQARIFGVLGRWVMAADDAVAADLAAIGADAGEDEVRAARRLFAAALDVRGGFKVQTLHGFASSLLGAFPLEASVVPGFETLDDRTGLRLKRDVLERAITDAAGEGDAAFLDDLGQLAVRKGDANAQKIIGELLRDREHLLAFASEAQIDARLRRVLKLGAATPAEAVRAARADGLDAALRGYAGALAERGAPTEKARIPAIEAFLDGAGQDELAALFETVFTKAGAPRAVKEKLEPEMSRAAEALGALREELWRFEILEAAALHLRVGRRLAGRYEEAKHSRGAVDFDDLIARAARLLRDISTSWVLYKLDQRIEHVLVDEGQDTNAAQWTIVTALVDEFFSGLGAHDEAADGARTFFAVGDYKQAIFGFQGTDPEEFRRARKALGEKAGAAGQELVPVPLAQSFRSVPAVLAVTDAVLLQAGHEALGLDAAVERHVAHRAGVAGAVTLWPRLGSEENPLEEAEAERPERAMAGRIAAEVKGWIDGNRFLPSKRRAIHAGDVLVLVRSRSDLVPELVAALHKEGVEVAGADRLRLTNPIAVQDCLSLIRFALQPDDDLSLAELLVSPFLGWSQDELYALAQPRPEGRPLWQVLRGSAEKRAEEAASWLEQVLKIADFLPPYEFLEAVLSGPLGGREKLLARLGPEARDPLDELLNQAFQYERGEAPSLQGFLDWLGAADDLDVKRDPEGAARAVRIITVHGAKGLQAPVVILADAAKAGAERGPSRLLLPGEDGAETPVYGYSKASLPGDLAEKYAEEEAREARENLRLLYVALTRAEDYLYVGGLAPRSDKQVSWWDRTADAIRSLDHEEEVSDRWGGHVLRHRQGDQPEPGKPEDIRTELVAVPDWAREEASPEASPPRPLSPSAGEDEDGLPPPGPALERAAERGRLLHRLFERLPDIPPDERDAAMRGYLEKRAPEAGLDAGDLAAEVSAVMADPALAELFSSDALREAPVTAVVGEQVIAGTLDLLLVTPDRVRVVDFKTDRQPPETADGVRERHRTQMQRYVAALEAIFPGRTVEAGLLYTAGPSLIWL